MKRIVLTLSILGMSFLLNGCWDRVEVNDLAIVTGAAIDKKKDAKEGEKIHLSVQVIIPRALGGGTGGGGGGGGAGGAAAAGGKTTLVRSGDGLNIADAMSQVQGKLPRKIFWGHCKIFIFGQEIAKEGIGEQVDFLLRDPETRNRADIFISKGRAEKALELFPPLERYSAEVVRQQSELHFDLGVTLTQLLMMIRSETAGGAVPLIDILPPGQTEKETETIPYIVGSAVFRRDKMIGTITKKETRGLLWLKNQIQYTTVTVKVKNVKGYISIYPIRARTKLIPTIENGNWRITVKVNAQGDLVQNGTNLDSMNEKWMAIMEDALKKEIQARIQLLLNKAQRKMKVDIFGFGDEFHRKYPKQWQSVKDRWEKKLSEVEVRMDIEAHILRPGLATEPAGIPDNEVRRK